MKKSDFNRSRYETEKQRIREKDRTIVYCPVDRAKYERNYDRIFRKKRVT